MSYMDLQFPWYQNGIKTVVPSGKISLRQFINSVVSPKPHIKQAFIDIQKAAERGDLKEKDRLKQENLFFVTPSVDLKYRNYDSIKNFLPLAVLEYDKIEYPRELKHYIFHSFDSCIFAFLSPSKTGCKFIFLLEKAPESVEEYKEYYFGIAHQLDKFVGFDPCNANVTLPLFCSWDEQALYREDAVGSSLRGYKENAFDPNQTVDFTPPEDIDPKIEQKVVEKIQFLINRIDDNAHPQLLGISFLCGGWCGASYIGEELAYDTLIAAVEDNDYMSKNTQGYKRTAKQMFFKGLDYPAEFKE